MIHLPAVRAALLAAVLASACQSYETQPQRTAIDGRWASVDGIFVADFRFGTFTSRFAQTDEILARGSYTISGADIALTWLSVQAQERRSAICTFTSATTVQCTQPDGSAFGLIRMV